MERKREGDKQTRREGEKKIDGQKVRKKERNKPTRFIHG